MSSSVFVRNLPYDVTKAALEQVFGDVGPVKHVDVIKDKGKRKSETTSRGFAFVKFATEADAALAIEKLNQTDFRGRKLHVEIAAEKKPKRQRNHQTPREPTQQQQQEPVTQEASKEEEPVEHQEQQQTEQEEPSKPANEEKKKTKKAKQQATKDEESAQPAKAVEPMPEQTRKDAKDQKDDTNTTQSERNARRRQHREFLRQVRERKEAAADANDKSITIFNIAEDVPKKKLMKLVKRHAAISEFTLHDPNAAENTEDAENGDQAPSVKKNKKKMAIVQLKLLKDVDNVISKLDGHSLNGLALQVRQGRLTDEDFKPVKASGADQKKASKPVLLAKAQQEGLRLIIRNLSFQVTDEDLEKCFEEIGPLYEARVVRMPVGDSQQQQDDEEQAESIKKKPVLGRSRGFGFVQFRDVKDARKAVESKNGLKLKGREIVVDFAVPKAKYLQQQNEEVADKQEEQEEGESADNESGHDAEDADADAGNEEEGSEADNDEADEDAEEDDDEDEEEPVAKKNKKDTTQQMERTLFIRNLSFQSTDESVKAFFETFGPVEYARVVYDYASGLSKGVAFVRFKSKQVAHHVLAESAQQASVAALDVAGDGKKKQPLAAAAQLLQPQTGLVFDGRVISVAPAMQKEQADQIAESLHGTKKKDKRNLYLASEGTINVNKIAEEDLHLPKGDIEKRRRALQEKKTKLKNPLFFVSPTRLSVRNVAAFVDDKLLKQIFKDAATKGMAENLVDVSKEVPREYQLPVADDKKKQVQVKVKMAKIVREEDAKPGKEPRSRGYGFVEFEHHVHALAALRKLNNNPAFTKYAPGGAAVKGGKKVKLEDHEKPRLIVEFALENHAKLKLREKRQRDAEKRREEEKHLREAQGDDEDENKQEEGSKKRKSRGQRQREAKKARKENPEEATKAATKNKSDSGSKKRPREENSDMAHSKKSKKQVTPKSRPPKDDLDLVAQQMEEEVASNGKNGKKLSRKQRKAEAQREKKQESNFEDMVREYKKQLFGGNDSKSSASASKERWFEME